MSRSGNNKSVGGTPMQSPVDFCTRGNFWTDERDLQHTTSRPIALPCLFLLLRGDDGRVRGWNVWCVDRVATNKRTNYLTPEISEPRCDWPTGVNTSAFSDMHAA